MKKYKALSKRKRTEILWLISVLFFYFMYNLPFFPKYHNAPLAILHGILTLVPLWLCVYIGFFKLCHLQKIRRSKNAKL